VRRGDGSSGDWRPRGDGSLVFSGDLAGSGSGDGSSGEWQRQQRHRRGGSSGGGWRRRPPGGAAPPTAHARAGGVVLGLVYRSAGSHIPAAQCHGPAVF
jgi:hypothetical protein